MRATVLLAATFRNQQFLLQKARACARINTLHETAAVLIVEREGLDVIVGCKIVGKYTQRSQPPAPAATVREGTISACAVPCMLINPSAPPRDCGRISYMIFRGQGGVAGSVQ